MNLGLYMQISHDPGSHDPNPGPQEKSMKKSCVSLETECMFASGRAIHCKRAIHSKHLRLIKVNRS